jgi:hypothetical protein
VPRFMAPPSAFQSRARLLWNTAMQVLLIICHDDDFRPTAKLISDIHVWIKQMSDRGVRVHGNPLRPASDAVTLRMRRGRLQRTNGPFSDAKEKLCGYELIECKDFEEAVAVAAEHPMTRAATIEVREVWDELAR